MRAKREKRPPSPPSEDEGDENFVTDPDQIFDDLPQPFRLVDKTVRKIFDNAWEIIEEIEERKALRRSKAVLPLFDLGKELSDHSKTSCICTLPNGNYLFLGCDRCLTVVDSLLGTTVACIEDTGNDITQMSACYLLDGYYLIASVDNGGFARLYLFTADKVVLVKTFNDQDGQNKQSAATFVLISQDGGYIGIGWKAATKESWLEIYRVPKETWIKEVDAALMAFAPSSRKPTLDSVMDTEEPLATDQLLAKPTDDQGMVEPATGSRPSSAQGGQTQPGQSGTSFTKPVTVLRVRPPAPVGPCAATNCSAALKAIDAECNVIGSGANHVLMSQYFDNCDKAFHSIHVKELKYLNKDEEDLNQFPKIHFLTPSKLIPSGLESGPTKVNSIAVWWSKGTQLFIYSLVKTSKDLEHKADVVWPNSDQLALSEVSECGSFMAMGLRNGTVVVWDIYRGTLLQVYPITDKGNILVLCFLPNDVCPVVLKDDEYHITSSTSSLANLVVSCDDGTFCLLQCSVAFTPPPKPLVDKSAVETPVITNVTKMPQTPEVIITVKKSGDITLYDVISCTAICHVALQEPFVLSSQLPCLCADGKILVLIGLKIDEENESNSDSKTATPFCFSLKSFPTLNKYWKEDVSLAHTPHKMSDTINTRLHSLVKQRILSQEERQLKLEQRWSQYKTELKNIQKNKTRRNYSMWLTSNVLNY
ncbi:WD repeat-containing protein 93-like [Acropora millepora]|uniref:WD repeat-containing protein 93-like n=1 Tax=Acropora millepora TaxID=45264 RepID=UPI001CF4BF6E|nr:WD repeat-containing protein 93-like [Acropora millepora]